MTREEAIEIFREWINEGFSFDGGYAAEELDEDEKEALDMAISALQDRPIGHWIKVEDNGKILSYQCSCGCAYKQNFNFCPNCGAKME